MSKFEISKLPADLQEIVLNNKVVVFSKSYCPYCKSTKGLLSSMGVDYYVRELDQESGGSAVQDALAYATDQRSVPNIFINGDWIGGNDKLQAKNSTGELEKLLEQEYKPPVTPVNP